VSRLGVALVLAVVAGCSVDAHEEPRPPIVAENAAARSTSRVLSKGKLTKLTADRGQLVAELDGKTPVRLVIATRNQPLLPRSRAAHFRIAEKLAPGLVAPTAFRSFKLAELLEFAEPTALAVLEKEARVLGNGRVEAVLALSPAPTLTRVDLTNLQENQIAWRWEGKLVVRERVPEADRVTLSEYQSLLAVDWILGNGKRRWVQLHEKSGRITVADQCEAFSATPDDNAVHDALGRFARHMTYSRSLNERLRALTRERVEKALKFGKPAMLLVTPKQAEEIADNARALERVIQTRVKQRGEADALGLP
jgi:hypothetical protein